MLRKFTALDAVELGLATHLVEDGCRGVNLSEGDLKKALDEMQRAGIRLLESEEV